MNNLKVTTMSKLSDYAKGELVQLSGWNDDEPFVARLRRASLTGMIKAGKIPNPLIGAAQKLYEGSRSRANPGFEETAKVYRLVAEAALVEPNLEQINAAGLDLTEKQADEIYVYAIRGAKALETFRNVTAGAQSDQPINAVQDAAEPVDGD